MTVYVPGTEFWASRARVLVSGNYLINPSPVTVTVADIVVGRSYTVIVNDLIAVQEASVTIEVCRGN